MTPDTLMRNSLQEKGFLPNVDPYSFGSIEGGSINSRFEHYGSGRQEWTPDAVLFNTNFSEEKKIVDWVFVELRSSSDSTQIIETRTALLNRAGFVVNPLDGLSPLVFEGFEGESYYVAIKHRNHLGAMTALPVLLSVDTTKVDFTKMENDEIYYLPHPIEGSSYFDLGMATLTDGRRALWAGDVDQNGQIKYQGTNSDLVSLLSRVLFDPLNVELAPNFAIAEGYHNADTNLDGLIKYSGINNDLFLIFLNILLGISEINTGNLFNYDLMLEQLPRSE